MKKMKQSPKNCIVCGAGGTPQTWNGIDILNCRSCGLAWRASFDIPVDYYAKLNAGRPEPGEGKIVSRLRNAEDRLASTMRFLPKDGVCDIGCGDGSFLSALKEEGYRNCFGIEPSYYNCEIASKNQLEVIKGDVSSLGQEAQKRKIRAITLFHVIEHLSGPMGVLQNIKNVLRPGGVLVIETPDSNASIQKVTDHKNALIYHEHLFYWNEKALRMILKKLGFRILAIQHRSFDWKNAPIRASLARLGFFNKSFVNFGSQEGKTSEKIGPINNGKKLRNNPFRKLMRSMLAYLVHSLGRDDYIFVVAERT
ncbi:MAG: class I SAM-dependent methyltransferase [Patescibacteria group bacterium]